MPVERHRVNSASLELHVVRYRRQELALPRCWFYMLVPRSSFAQGALPYGELPIKACAAPYLERSALHRMLVNAYEVGNTLNLLRDYPIDRARCAVP